VTVGRGAKAPEFSLTGSDGAAWTLAGLTANGPGLLAFFNTSCPTCQLAFPVVGELQRRVEARVPVVAVAQDDLPWAKSWCEERGFEGVVLDDSRGYAASAAYDLDCVPTLVLIEPGGTVAEVVVGWDRSAFNGLGEVLDAGALPLSAEDDGRPPSQPG